jgi:two-component system, response regulator, stage 0 sporulation protein F
LRPADADAILRLGDRPYALKPLPRAYMRPRIAEETMPVLLHVEDEYSVRFLYKEVFEELGYEVIQAASGEEALRMLRGTRPDIIILDLKMPGMGGRGFLEKFRKLKMRIPVVISTAYPFLEDDPATKTADAFVVKSGDMDNLVEKVNSLVGKAASG